MLVFLVSKAVLHGWVFTESIHWKPVTFLLVSAGTTPKPPQSTSGDTMDRARV